MYAERRGDVAHVEEKGLRVPDAELDDPLHDRDIEVPGEHQGLRLGRGGLGELGLHVGPCGAEPELHLELALDRDLLDGLDPERELQVRAGLGGAHVGAEALDDPHLLRLDLVVAREEQEQDGEHDHHEAYRPRGQLRQTGKLDRLPPISMGPSPQLPRAMTPPVRWKRGLKPRRRADRERVVVSSITSKGQRRGANVSGAGRRGSTTRTAPPAPGPLASRPTSGRPPTPGLPAG